MYLSWRIWFIYLVLFAFAVPWYWQFFPALAVNRWTGVPVWAASSVLASFFVSCFTALLLLRRWPDEDDDPANGPKSGAST